MISADYEALSERYAALFEDIARGERAREAGEARFPSAAAACLAFDFWILGRSRSVCASHPVLLVLRHEVHVGAGGREARGS